jgi:cyclopropane fatty-acyl-phospholipid synthase-like methyltransferase
MEFIRSKKYEHLLKENMMGPNCLKILEELMADLPVEPGKRVLDLGCGKGLTSIFLAREYGATVFATDLWIGATENYERFLQEGLGDRIIPIHADAHDLPYAEGYFDAVVSIDSYYYFGMDPGFMDQKLSPLLKKGGLIALAFPGLKEELSGIFPGEMALSWKPEDVMDTFHSCGWWQAFMEGSHSIGDIAVRDMGCCEESWRDWLLCDNPYAVSDRPAMEAGAGKYMSLISIMARKK